MASNIVTYLLKIDPELKKQGMAKAGREKRSFAKHIAYLLQKDLDTVRKPKAK